MNHDHDDRVSGTDSGPLLILFVVWHLKLIANYKTCIVSCSYRYLYRPMHSIPYDLRADTNRSPYLPASPNCAKGPSYSEICPTRHRSRLAKLSSVLKNQARNCVIRLMNMEHRDHDVEIDFYVKCFSYQWSWITSPFYFMCIKKIKFHFSIVKMELFIFKPNLINIIILFNIII